MILPFSTHVARRRSGGGRAGEVAHGQGERRGRSVHGSEDVGGSETVVHICLQRLWANSTVGVGRWFARLFLLKELPSAAENISYHSRLRLHATDDGYAFITSARFCQYYNQKASVSGGFKILYAVGRDFFDLDVFRYFPAGRGRMQIRVLVILFQQFI